MNNERPRLSRAYWFFAASHVTLRIKAGDKKAMGHAAEALKYRAFVSYSRADRVWAKLLQSRLERYVLPRALRAVEPGLKREARPLKPVFRDEDELVPGSDLPARIRAGLAHSEFLIVVCSPHAVASEWVDKEIRDFVALRGASNILAIVVDGEPNALANGFDDGKECLPDALRFELDVAPAQSGNASATISTRTAEPLWIDWRQNNKRDRTSFLRVIAALLSLDSLDTLIDRDRAYRRRQGVLAGVSALAVALALAGFSAALALRSRSEAINNSNTLAGLARQAAQAGDWERSARYALLGMRDAGAPLIGFEARAATDALAGVAIGNRRLGPPLTIGTANAATAISRNGAVLAIEDLKSGTVRILDASNAKEVRPPLNVGRHGGFVLSPDGRYLATVLPPSTADGEPITVFRVWDINTGKEACSPLKGVMAFASAVEFSPDNTKLFVVGSFNDGGGYAQMFDLKTGQAEHFGGSPLGIDAIAFSPDGQLAGMASSDGVQIWNLSTGKAVTGVMQLGGAAGGKRIAFAPDDKTIALTNELGSLIFWDYREQKETANSSLGQVVADLQFSADGRRFAVRFDDGNVRVWEGSGPDDYAARGVLFTPAGDFAFLADGKRLISISAGNVRYWALAAFNSSAAIPGAELLNKGAAFSPDGAVMALSAEGGKIIMRDTTTMAQIGPALPLEGDREGVFDGEQLAFSPDGRFVARQNEAGTWLTEWRTGKQWRLAGEAASRGAMVFSPDGAILATARQGMDNYSDVGFWEVHTRKPLGKPLRAQPFATSLSFSPDGGTLAIAAPGRAVTLWDVHEGVRRVPPLDGTSVVALSPDGKYLVTGGRAEDTDQDEKVQTWTMAKTSALGSAVTTDVGTVSQISFFGEGGRAMLVGRRAIVLWDPVLNVAIGPSLEFHDDITAAYISEKGDRLMALAGGRLYERRLSPGPNGAPSALVKMICQTVVPGALSHLSSKELSQASFLNDNRDTDSCRQTAYP